MSTNPASAFTLDIYRTGYYGGDGGRLVKRLGKFAGITQPDPPIGIKRVRHCVWQPCAEITIPKDWLSGVYLGK
ncbi:MAG TPA: N,N-dimethylformamidase beta subunit family domain-containing protein, partial [Lacipirellulaceae bacterium]|nr:N,N-dimethylformamidase beta subunit family domain-containing protein [Lacipirellulaceae bacterium]